MWLKKGVKVKGLQPEILLGIFTAQQLFREKGREFTITSCTDGKHMPGSKHYVGQAIDIRTSEFDQYTQKDLVNELKLRLGVDYDVVLEDDHLHLEHDEK